MIADIKTNAAARLRNALMSVTGYAHSGAEELCAGSGSEHAGARLIRHCALLRANVALIAAAPNMLVALQDLMTALDQDREPAPFFLEQARAVIAQATRT